MPDSLREFHVEVAARPVYPVSDPAVEYAYRVTITRGPLTEWRSPWEVLQATDSDAALAEARDRAALVMVMVQGAHVESLTPRGVGDDGRPT